MTEATPIPFRSRCSIARGLDLLGDKWTLLVVRDLLWHGKHSFQALQASEEHIPSNILSDRLQRLLAQGLVRRERYLDHPPRYHYHLTEKGRALEPALLALMRWGHDQLGGGLYDPTTGQSQSPGAR